MNMSLIVWGKPHGPLGQPNTYIYVDTCICVHVCVCVHAHTHLQAHTRTCRIAESLGRCGRTEGDKAGGGEGRRELPPHTHQPLSPQPPTAALACAGSQVPMPTHGHTDTHSTISEFYCLANP